MTCGQTDQRVLDVAQRLGKSLGIASAMVLGEQMGFIHNYVWRQIKKAAMTVVDQGHGSVEDVDRAVMLGMRCPNGPFQMMDRAGLDVMLDIERQWHAESGDERDRPPKILEDLVAAGHLGQKTGRGFYTYPDPAYERPGWLLGQDD
jgi:3-hydroxybutyryl-CoA dehydrogenase